jgi:hypothetical protein
MKRAVSRVLMAMAVGCLGESRREWSTAMLAEFEAAADEGDALPFAGGCLVAAWREMSKREEGHFLLSSYGLALGLMVPMAALQIGCAVMGLPYLFPGSDGLPVPLVKGGAHEVLLRTAYLNGVPSFTLLLLVLGVGHLRLAWVMLEHDWSRVVHVAAAMVAAAATLVFVMSAFFLDSSGALLQIAMLAIELVIVALVARWHARIFASLRIEHPG